jgi:hypothetical protein
MTSYKEICGLQKQNDSIASSLENRGIEFTRTVIDADLYDALKFELMRVENVRLKEIVAINKPPPQVKEKKVIPPVVIEKEESFEDPVKTFDTIINMEDLKRAFFNDDFASFEKCVTDNSLKYYNVTYKFSSDKDGAPEFSATNLINGFTRSFEEYKKYFMICFRCWKLLDSNVNEYVYESIWLINITEPIQNVIGDLYDDFNFIEIVGDETFFGLIRKVDGKWNLEDNDLKTPPTVKRYECIKEAYVH